jgi:hypothetical protein
MSRRFCGKDFVPQIPPDRIRSIVGLAGNYIPAPVAGNGNPILTGQEKRLVKDDAAKQWIMDIIATVSMD